MAPPLFDPSASPPSPRAGPAAANPARQCQASVNFRPAPFPPPPRPANPVAMNEPLAFYPARSVVQVQYGIVAIAAGLGLVLLWSLTHPPADESAWSWLRDLAKIGGIVLCGAVAGFAVRRARRIAAARANREPQLVIDPFGVLVRDDFLWRPHRFPWSRIRSIDPLPDSKGVSIVLRGDLRPLGRMVDVTTDSDEPAEAIALRLERYARRPTMH